jgi:predicted dehydrogenase
MQPLRLGFIGLGYITVNAHLPALAPLAKSGQVVLTAFCDTQEETARSQAAEYGVNGVYTDHRAMLEQEALDAVYLCIPPTLHTDQLTLAAERGLAVFVEKPQTLDLAQAVACTTALERAGVVSQVGFMSRYYPSAAAVRRRLSERTPRHALVQLLYGGRPVRYWTSRYELCGGTFVENTIHMVDLLRYFLGDIAAVSAFYVPRTEPDGEHGWNLPHVYNVNYRFVSGATANVTTSRVLTQAGGSRRQVTLVSDDSLIEWESNKASENGDVVWQDEAPANPFALQAQEFVAAAQAGDRNRPRSPYAEALNSLAAVLGANASAEQGGRLVQLADLVAGKR